MFKKIIFILLIITVVAFISYTYIKNAIINKITVNFVSVDISKFRFSFPNPTVDVAVRMSILNLSTYSFKVRNLEVLVFDNNTRELIGTSYVNQLVPIIIGENIVDIEVPNIDVLSNANNYFANSSDLFIVVEFKIFGVSIRTEETVELSR